MVPNPAYEQISALDLADVCMIKNPAYETVQPWQRESVTRYKARTAETSPTFKSRPLPCPPELEEKRKKRQFRHEIKAATMPVPVQITDADVLHGCENDLCVKWSSPVQESTEVNAQA